MPIVVWMSVLVGAIVIVGLAVVFSKMAPPKSALPVTSEWIEELSTDRYRPMMRLLDSRDIEFLRSQPGYTPKMESRLRAQRCQIFRGYLRILNVDFERVVTALKVVMTHSEQDRPDLAATLVQQQVRFASAMMAVHVRLFLHQRGIGQADVAVLLKVFNGVRLELGSMVPSTSGACA